MPGRPPKPTLLGVEPSVTYRALIARMNEQSDARFAKMTKRHVVTGSAWTLQDLACIEAGAPVIAYAGEECDLSMGFCLNVGVGPWEETYIHNGLVWCQKVIGKNYASAYVPSMSVEIIDEPEFYKLFKRPWTRWRKFRWWMKHWT